MQWADMSSALFRFKTSCCYLHATYWSHWPPPWGPSFWSASPQCRKCSTESLMPLPSDLLIRWGPRATLGSSETCGSSLGNPRKKSLAFLFALRPYRPCQHRWLSNTGGPDIVLVLSCNALPYVDSVLTWKVPPSTHTDCAALWAGNLAVVRVFAFSHSFWLKSSFCCCYIFVSFGGWDAPDKYILLKS